MIDRPPWRWNFFSFFYLHSCPFLGENLGLWMWVDFLLGIYYALMEIVCCPSSCYRNRCSACTPVAIHIRDYWNYQTAYRKFFRPCFSSPICFFTLHISILNQFWSVFSLTRYMIVISLAKNNVPDAPFMLGRCYFI